MPFLFSFLVLVSFQSFSEEKRRAWSVGGGHSYSRGLSYSDTELVTNSLSFSYSLGEKRSFSISSSYLQPLDSFISDRSSYGFTDTSLSFTLPFPFFTSFVENFLGMKAGNAVGFTLPTSERSLQSGKYASIFVKFYYFTKFSFLNFHLEHVLYSGFYEYRSDPSGFVPNRLASTYHTLSLDWTYKKLSLGTGLRFYLYAYLADLDSDPEVTDTHLRFKGGQGGSVEASYKLPYSLLAYGRTFMNIPTVSPILVGFPLFDYKNISYSAGVRWKF